MKEIYESAQIEVVALNGEEILCDSCETETRTGDEL